MIINGIGLPAGTKRPLSRSNVVIGNTSAYLAGGSNSNMFLTAFGYRGRRVITFEAALPASTTAANSNKFLTNVSKGNIKKIVAAAKEVVKYDS